MNRCFYRVVAADANGTESICSDFVKCPSALLVQPANGGQGGRPFAYEPKLITSLGDVQHHYEAPHDQLWTSRSWQFVLSEGPPWLTLDRRPAA